MMGIDPIEARRAERARQRLEAAKVITLAEVAEAYIAAHKSGWRNGKHKAQWENTLKTHAAPISCPCRCSQSTQGLC
jgi:hypothetical protein